MKVLICGFGNMGKTFANSFVNARYIKSSDIYILLKNQNTFSENNNFSSEQFVSSDKLTNHHFDLVILSVKPQDFDHLASQIATKISKECVIISVMAGIKIKEIEKKIQSNKIVRCMPNLATEVGDGMTVYHCSDNLDRKDLFIVQNLINTTGKSVFVDKEDLIDAATAISGSGPAYVFYFMESLINKAKKLGFSESEASFLVTETFNGAVSLLKNSNISNREWINKVTSKGGTTEQALLHLNNNFVSDIFEVAVEKAYQRAKELGNQTNEKIN